MILIKKGSEPNEWTRYRLTSGVEFRALPELKDSLLKEQGYLCAYCMARIDKDHMKVEHFNPQSLYPDDTFTYRNLLACCLGKTEEESHCDTSKGNAEIKLSPLEPSCVDTLSYESGTGAIKSSNESYNKDLDTLNLNALIIKDNRHKALRGVINALKDVGFKGSAIHRLLDHWTAADKDGKREPYCGIVIYYLKKSKKKS
nr:retron system putative HNH endonuclease [uncultured Porphyromonas sp.]